MGSTDSEDSPESEADPGDVTDADASDQVAQVDGVWTEKTPVDSDEEFEAKQREVELEAQRVALDKDRVGVDKERADLQKLRDALDSEIENRKLRKSYARAAVVVMIVQIAFANAVFVWYGDTNGWDISSTAISSWLGATVIQVVAVVLVVMNYLFPSGAKDKSRQ